MKNLNIFYTEVEILDYVRGLWKSEAFAESFANGGIVFDIVKQFAKMPRFFCDMSNDRLERAHFSTWWGVITRREDYTNPLIHDLYYLHEFYHAGHMPYIPGIGRKAFEDKMQRNELEASTLSEIQIYFEIPSLRKDSFTYPIYADRFLEDAQIRNLWDRDRVVAIETIRSIRRDVMVSKPEHLMDETEVWIRRFTDQNDAYSIIWADRYSEIEARMADFQQQAGQNRHEAALAHLEWLETQAELDLVDQIPFREEAELFSAFYWSNKAKYQAAMAK